MEESLYAGQEREKKLKCVNLVIYLLMIIKEDLYLKFTSLTRKSESIHSHGLAYAQGGLYEGNNASVKKKVGFNPILPGLLNTLQTQGAYFTPLLIRLFLS